MLIIDHNRFYEGLGRRGYRSLLEFAKAIGVHRNTLHHYLSGRGVLPESLEKVLRALGMKFTDLFVEKIEPEQGVISEDVSRVVDALHAQFPFVTFVLFGARAEGRAQRYSDWDIGVFSRRGLDHETYREVLKKKSELAEDLPYTIDIINLHQADARFLRAISRGWIMLAGFREDWVDLQRRVAA